MINDQYRAALIEDMLRIVFSANLVNVDRAVEDARKFIKTIKLEGHCFAIILGLREALINAADHGCKFDNCKKVSCLLKLEPDKFIIEVEDEGKGFDWRAADGKCPHAIKTSGRGRSIMDIYFTEVCFNEKGNKLRLTLSLDRPLAD